MSDKELIELLRRMSPRLDMLDCENVLTAADRIEELIAERDQAWERAAHAEKMWGETEVKLAKAVTRLQHIAANKTTGELTVIEWDTYDMFTLLDACISEARTTLAEITGGKDD